MSSRAIDHEVLFIGEAPTVEIRDGFAHVIDENGSKRLERVMSVHTLRIYARRTEAALAAFDAAQGDVVREFRSKKPGR